MTASMGDDMHTKNASGTDFYVKACQELQAALEFMRKKFATVSKYHGKAAKAFWSESKGMAEDAIDCLESNLGYLNVKSQDDWESLEDAIYRMKRGYNAYTDQMSLAYWTATAAVELRDRLEGRKLIVLVSQAELLMESLFDVDLRDLDWDFPAPNKTKPVAARPHQAWSPPPSHPRSKSQAPANAGVFHNA
ncbi:hypothetical protein E7T06_07355 [Deinococcus sp. Arct2-2]|uniref:hypothetical protein n=1 Tax=Deinococcus sp. Arct2-2 TaxID=2568653 RepID=UPI0010A35D0C|nr:hypothetical protein [Deinococcus sp. Arct2-2]THF70514.1 hypothetical protein E7T06_07355 [Deinococcus sp. Arct2-2]